jgi:hypothetical protein
MSGRRGEVWLAKLDPVEGHESGPTIAKVGDVVRVLLGL